MSQAFENNRSQFEFWFGCFLFCLFYYLFSIFFLYVRERFSNKRHILKLKTLKFTYNIWDKLRFNSQRIKTDTFLPKYGSKGYRYDMFLRNFSHSLKADTKRPVNLILCENTCSAMAQKNPNRIKASRWPVCVCPAGDIVKNAEMLHYRELFCNA